MFWVSRKTPLFPTSIKLVLGFDTTEAALHSPRVSRITVFLQMKH